MNRSKDYLKHTKWDCKYYVVLIPVGRDEAEIRHYIREQEKEDKRLDQLKMFE